MQNGCREVSAECQYKCNVPCTVEAFQCTKAYIHDTFWKVSLRNMANYTACTLYEHGFGVFFDWDQHLDEEVFKYHDLTQRQNNTLVELQMGTILSFIAACASTKTRGLFFTEPSVLNLFRLNIVASSVGKSQSRKKFISNPIHYMMQDTTVQVQDFEGCNFTRAGNIFRWFKFTLKPPNSMVYGNSFSAIWDTSHWNIFVKFGLKTPYDIS